MVPEEPELPEAMASYWQPQSQRQLHFQLHMTHRRLTVPAQLGTHQPLGVVWSSVLLCSDTFEKLFNLLNLTTPTKKPCCFLVLCHFDHKLHISTFYGLISNINNYSHHFQVLFIFSSDKNWIYCRYKVLKGLLINWRRQTEEDRFVLEYMA